MQFKVRHDWITLSGKVAKNEGAVYEKNLQWHVSHARTLLRAIGLSSVILNTCPPEKYYALAFVDERSGIRVHYGENLSTQGYKIVSSGTSCAYLEDLVLLKNAVEVHKLKVTRFDYAVDLIDSGIRPGDEYDAYVSEFGRDGGKKKGYTNKNGADTFTLGSRSSERYLRVYDKAGEQGIPVDWIRVELEYKDAYAHHAFETYCHNYAMLTDDVCKFIRNPQSVVIPVLQKIALGEVAERVKRPTVVGDTEKWLRGQVRSAFEKLALREPDAAWRCLVDFNETYVAASLWIFVEGDA